MFSLTSGSSAAWAEEPAQPARATTPAATDAVEPTPPAEVLKTKTRSNQSND